MANVYRLTAQAKTMTWKEWKKIGGCGLSAQAELLLRNKLVAVGKVYNDNPPLGDIANNSIIADREMARFGVDRLGLKDWAYLEYENGRRVSFDINGGVCDRSQCGDYSHGPCDNDTCSARIDV